MIPITGQYLPLYLMHKIDKNIGTEKFLVYLAAWVEAKKRGLFKVKLPDSFSSVVKKRIEELGAVLRGDGWIVMGNGRGYHGKDILPEILTHTAGLSNLVTMQTTIENKYPGSLEAIGLGTNEEEPMNKISSMLDSVADSLEAQGYIKAAYEVDKVADAVEAAQFDSSREIAQRAEALQGNIKGLQTALSRSPVKEKQPGLIARFLQDLASIYQSVGDIINETRMYGIKGDRAYNYSTGKSEPLFPKGKQIQ